MAQEGDPGVGVLGGGTALEALVAGVARVRARTTMMAAASFCSGMGQVV